MQTREITRAWDYVPMQTIIDRYQPGDGRHFFDRAAMRFFRSRLPEHGYEGPGGVYFVTSEQFEYKGRKDPRGYTVRRLVGPGELEECSPFNELTYAAAHRLAKQLAGGR